MDQQQLGTIFDYNDEVLNEAWREYRATPNSPNTLYKKDQLMATIRARLLANMSLSN